MDEQQTGTVIEGTMRPEDLIPAFMDELKRVSEKDAVEINTIYASETAYMLTDEYCENGFYNHPNPEDIGFLVESLFDRLDFLAPDGYYFGAHPGDGSDFGYWPIEDEL